MSVIGWMWLTMPIRPIVAMIAVIARATGSSAATSAPKAMSRMPSATGTAESLGTLEVVPERVGDRLRHAGAADLPDPQRLVVLLHPVDGLQHGLHAVARALGVAAHVELHQRAAPVLGDRLRGVRRPHVRGLAGPVDGLDDRADGGPELGVRGLQPAALRLDQDRLTGRFVDPGVVDDLCGGVCLALELVAVLEFDAAGGRTEPHRQDDEQHPDTDGSPSVPGAPAAGPGGYAPHP